MEECDASDADLPGFCPAVYPWLVCSRLSGDVNLGLPLSDQTPERSEP
jgi:hypothetical protein